MKCTYHSLLALVIGLFLSAATAASTLFSPTDGDMNFLFHAAAADNQFAIFDDDNTTLDPTQGMLLLGSSGADLVTVDQQGGDWLLSNGNGSLLLSGSADFVLAASPSGFAWFADGGIDNVTSNPIANIYTLLFANANIEVTLVDAAVATPVPVPAPLFLLASGLIALAAVARRK